MLKQPERESRNVNDLFYEMEGRQIQKMNKVLEGVELTKAEERTMIWLAGWEESTVDHLLSVIEKTARIRAEKKGGYAHSSHLSIYIFNITHLQFVLFHVILSMR